MAYNPTLKNKVSSHIQTQLPEYVKADHPTFALFLKHYYQFLEAGELILTGSNEYLIEETLTKNYILDQQNEKIVLEESVGKFTAGETITGSISKATATILVDDFDDNNRLFITAQQQFITGETITGNTSGATSTISSYRANPVQNIQQLLDYADVDGTVYDFLDKFKASFMESLPNTLASDISKRKLLKSIKDMYAAKGTRDGHKLFFRILFDETPTIVYPKDNLLRPSDGIWLVNKVIRIVQSGLSDFSNAIGQIVTGVTSGAKGRIQTVINFREGAETVTEITLDEDSIIGSFTIGESVESVDTTLDVEISGIIKGVVTDTSISDGGSYYNINDPVAFGTGGNNEVTAIIESIGPGTVDEILIDGGGSGYSVGDSIVFNNTTTDGIGASAKIAVVGGGFLLENLTSPNHMLLQTNDFIRYEDNEFMQHEQTVGDSDYLTLEDGSQIIIEEETFNDLGVSSEIGEITKVKMIDSGQGYKKTPTITVTSSGTGANLHALSTKSPRIGHAKTISITNFGLNYSTPPDLFFNRNIIVKDVVGSFSAGDTLTSHTATVVDYDANRKILELSTQVDFIRGDTITAITGATATIHQSDVGVGTTSVGTIGTSVGSFNNDRGKVSNITMRIQDSRYYQDYSYVVRVGQSINLWRESIRQTIHPAGWNVFGEVSFSTLISASMNTPTAGDVVDYTGERTFTPELATTFKTIFKTVFRRRLGTSTDGTSVNTVNPITGEETHTDFADNTRETTLQVRIDTSIGNTLKGLVLGPTLDLLPMYAFSLPPQTVDGSQGVIPNYPGIYRTIRSEASDSTYFTIEQFGDVRINQVSASDGSIPLSAYQTKTSVPPASEIIIKSTSGTFTFDATTEGFDSNVETFDEV
jgi:hypothetical protein